MRENRTSFHSLKAIHAIYYILIIILAWRVSYTELKEQEMNGEGKFKISHVIHFIHFASLYKCCVIVKIMIRLSQLYLDNR